MGRSVRANSNERLKIKRIKMRARAYAEANPSGKLERSLAREFCGHDMIYFKPWRVKKS